MMTTQQLYQLATPVTALWGISEKQSVKLMKLGIRTIGDFLFHFPARHDDYRTITPIASCLPGNFCVIQGTVWEVTKQQSRSRMTIVKAVIADPSGIITCTWFNQPYLLDSLKQGKQMLVAGKIESFRGTLSMQPQDFTLLEEGQQNIPSPHFRRLVPVYPETQGVSSKWIRHKLFMIFERFPHLPEFLPRTTMQGLKLMGREEAIRQIHFPDSLESFSRAKERIAFEELFLVQYRALQCKQQEQATGKKPLRWEKALVLEFIGKLPFSLTNAQKQVSRDILRDLEKDIPMRRLLEGDVGSGKTIVAALALLLIAKSGMQAAMMVPTELLAEQHFRKLTPLFKSFGLSIALITGSRNLMSTDEDSKLFLGTEDEYAKVNRKTLKELVACGKVDIVVGTQALIQADLIFSKLGFVIIDEQHRFGVKQRTLLQQKHHITPDLLMMTATPIPRSLALAVYGDLDLSVLDELPPGRQPILTRIIPKGRKNEAYNFITGEIQKGRQAFIVCPLIDESDKVAFKSVLAEYELLKDQVFSQFSVGLLHGRMKPNEKDTIMQKFHDGSFQILVSTTVIEVGIDVPNASIMLIESAERYGLAQLHQLRGRVGRGQYQSYCLLATESYSKSVAERLAMFVSFEDGFALAEADMSMRGPGQVYGVRQSGLPDFRMASLTDYKLIKRVREEVERVLRDELGQENEYLKVELAHLAEQEVYLQ